ncbi:MAG: hypothetical protein ACK4MW_02090, partial [Aquificaceae bacterium]
MRRLMFVFIILALIFQAPRSYGNNQADYCYVPPFVGTSVPPNVMIMLSIETPMQGAAHPPVVCSGDPRTSYSCSYASCSYSVSGKRISNCYDNSKTYYGYFDPDKCYRYVNDRFEPVGSANNHQCSGYWSGNFLNWATTMAVDAFRKAMTGGNRNIDSPGNTQLLAARQTLPPGHPWFPIKRIDNAQFYTPYSGTVYLIRYANGFVVCRDPYCQVGQSGFGESLFPTVSGQSALGAFKLQIEVCNPSKGLEANCNPQNRKPEGVIQKYADKMRFGL